MQYFYTTVLTPSLTCGLELCVCAERCSSLKLTWHPTLKHVFHCVNSWTRLILWFSLDTRCFISQPNSSCINHNFHEWTFYYYIIIDRPIHHIIATSLQKNFEFRFTRSFDCADLNFCITNWKILLSEYIVIYVGFSFLLYNKLLFNSNFRVFCLKI